MRLEGPAKKLSVYIGEADTYRDKPLYEALVETARTAGCAGVSVMRGVAGYGATSREHAKHGMRMSVDLPLLVHVIDSPDRITALAELFATMIGSGLITVEDVHVLVYRGDEAAEEGFTRT
jgi:hypothetical protein